MNIGYFYAVAGLGFRMILPPSSKSMLKSIKTSLALDTKIEGATTLLWIPVRNRMMMKAVATEKNGWFINEATNETSAVNGSPNQKKAPMATHTEVTNNNTLHLKAAG